MKSDRNEYKISYIEALPRVNDGERGLFHIITPDKTIPVEITISGTFLSTWKVDTDKGRESTLIEIGSLLVGCMFLYDDVHNMTLVTTDFPQNFQTRIDGYNKLKNYLQEQIDRKKNADH